LCVEGGAEAASPALSRRGGLFASMGKPMIRMHPQSMADLQPGDHACCFYATEIEHQAVIAPFLRQGLEQARKVLYVWDAHQEEVILGYLQEDGLDPRPYVEGGHLSLLNVHDVAARQRYPGAKGAADWVRAEVEQARSEGYSELWITGEMTWALWRLPNQAGLAQYESELNKCVPSSRCVCLCQYDRRRFGLQTLMNALKLHPFVAIGPGIYDNTAVLGQTHHPSIRLWPEPRRS
jgi:hypothetical protein